MQAKQLPIVDSDSTGAGSPSPVDGYWRSVDQLEQTPEYQEFLHREFPVAASEFPEGVSRRGWLKLMSASMALAGFSGCRYGPDQIAAFVNRPAGTIPGVPKQYATNFQLAGRAVHLLVSNMDGRPIKVDGNPAHPVMQLSEPNDLSGGKQLFASAGTDVFSQGAVLGLYDPDRASRVARRSESGLAPSSWDEFSKYANEHLATLKSSQGASLAILMSPSLSPSVNRLLTQAMKALPEATVVSYTSIDDSAQRAACEQAVGKPAELLLKLDHAKVICSLDSDLLGNDANMVVYSRQFAKGRDPEPGKMNRLYCAEARYSVTGAAADSRLPVRSSQIGALIARLEKRVDELLAGGQATPAVDGESAFDHVDATEQLDRFVEAAAEDLVGSKGASVVSVGSHQPFDVQVAALRLNKKLGNVGKTVQLMPSRSAVEGAETQSLAELVAGIDDGKVGTVWVLGDNPVYAAPGDIRLRESLEKLEHVVYLSEFEDETAKASSWSVPVSHQLESWGDVTGVDGSYGIGQPQILPLLGGKSCPEILSILLGKEESGDAIVRATADAVAGGVLSSRDWREALHDGYLARVSAEPVSGDWSVDAPIPTGTLDTSGIENGSLEVVFTQSDTLYDGRFAKNVWMQELPQVMTRLTWDNAAIVGPRTARKLGLKQGEVAVLVHGDKRLELPVFEMPGQAAGSIAVHLGYGRVCRDEAVSSDEQVVVGQDVSPLRSAESMHILTGVEVRGTSRPYKLATTQDHFALSDREVDITKQRASILIREGSLEQITEGGEDYVEHYLGTHHPPLESLTEEPIERLEKDATVPYQWGMTIDLNKCTGCNTCIVACQAENNIPVVGKEQVSRGREMHWIRVDRYFRGDVDTPKIVNQPLACLHCETAPCEQVCPVAATVHTEDGINAMAYNRCIGTRYCANNCPYKVRRFNYFNYNTEYGYFYGWGQRGKLEEASRKLQQLVLNPEVTVRGRGVMEKCTYCIQRVQNGKIHARNEGRPVVDGEIQSACQAACPTGAIVFGDTKDPGTKVSQLQNDPRAYSLLAELNTKPRTMHLARVRNTHQRLKTTDQLVVAQHGHGDADGHSSDEHSSDEHSSDEHSEQEATH